MKRFAYVTEKGIMHVVKERKQQNSTVQTEKLLKAKSKSKTVIML